LYSQWYWKILLAEFPLNDAQKQFLNQRIQAIRSDFVAGLLHRLLNNRQLDWAILKQYLQVDKAFASTLWPAATRILFKKLSGNTSPS